MSDIVIRPVATADRSTWEPLWNGYNAFYGRDGITALPAGITELTWRRFLDADEQMFALLAEIDDRVVGLVHFLFHRSTIQEAPVCYLQDLFTSPEARGSGVGRALIQAVYDAASTAGTPEVYWQTNRTNVAARALYDTLAADDGFIVYSHSL